MVAAGIRCLLSWWLRDVQVARLVNQGDLLPDSMILEVCHSGKQSCLICTTNYLVFFSVYSMCSIKCACCSALASFNIGR